jgi:integrase/recombinase XerD
MGARSKVKPLQDPREDGYVLDDDILGSWEIALRAERRSPRTIRIYRTQVEAFRGWCASMGASPRFDRRTIQTFLAAEADRGLEANTVLTRYKGLRALANFLADERETDGNVMVGLRQPKGSAKPVPVMGEDDLRALLKACEGKGFRDRRDMAALRILLDTGARASEVVGLQVGDVDIKAQMITLHGKGDKVRRVHIGPQTIRALDRYERERKLHRHSALPAYFLSQRGAWSYDGLADALAERAKAAGVEGFHIHKMRHTFAHRWLSAEGTEQGLMDTAGWSSREMLARYGASGRAARAAAEHERLGLGDL